MFRAENLENNKTWAKLVFGSRESFLAFIRRLPCLEPLQNCFQTCFRVISCRNLIHLQSFIKQNYINIASTYIFGKTNSIITNSGNLDRNGERRI